MRKRGWWLLVLGAFVVYANQWSGVKLQTPLESLVQKPVSQQIAFEQRQVKSYGDLAGITPETYVEEIKRSELSFDPLSYCLYYKPYFLFQATYGEIASDYYLFSLNTETGELVKIHKGFHGSFLIKGDQLLIRHTDHFFTCTIPNWQQLYEKKSLQTWDDFVSGKGNLHDNKTESYLSFACELPPALRLIDWEYIYCVKEGCFTKPGQKEILFISGRKPTYDIAVYTWVNTDMRVVEHLGTKSGDQEWMKVPTKNDEGMMNFRQAVFEDIDKDGCQEIFINSVYAAWMSYANPLLFLDFSQPTGRKRFQVLDTDPMNDTEILRTDSDLLLIGDAYIDDYRELIVQQIKYLQNTKQASLVLVNPIPAELKRKIKTLSHQRFNNGLFFGPVRKHLSFARTGRNLSDAGNPMEIHSKKWSKLPICPLYNANNPNLTPREKLYHTKRNEFLQQWVTKLDTGWNPFSGYTFTEDKSFFVDQNHAWKQLKQVVEVIPVFEQNRIFPVLIVVMKQEDREEESSFDRTVLCLYNQHWELQDCHLVEVNDRMHDLASLMLPLPQDHLLFAQYSHAPRYSAFHALLIQSKEIKETLAITDISGADVFFDQNQWLVHITKNHHYLATNWGDAGNGVGYLFDYIIDPLTKKIKDTEFTDFFQFKLVYLYYKYHFFHYHGTTTLTHDQSESQIIPILERYEKNLYYHELAPLSEGTQSHDSF